MRDKELLEKLAEHPDLRKRFEEILGIAENADGTMKTADEAEERAIDAVRGLGKDVLMEWSLNRGHEVNVGYEKRRDVERDGKKNFTGTAALGGSK